MAALIGPALFGVIQSAIPRQNGVFAAILAMDLAALVEYQNPTHQELRVPVAHDATETKSSFGADSYPDNTTGTLSITVSQMSVGNEKQDDAHFFTECVVPLYEISAPDADVNHVNQKFLRLAPFTAPSLQLQLPTVVICTALGVILSTCLALRHQIVASVHHLHLHSAAQVRLIFSRIQYFREKLAEILEGVNPMHGATRSLTFVWLMTYLLARLSVCTAVFVFGMDPTIHYIMSWMESVFTSFAYASCHGFILFCSDMISGLFAISVWSVSKVYAVMQRQVSILVRVSAIITQNWNRIIALCCLLLGAWILFKNFSKPAKKASIHVKRPIHHTSSPSTPVRVPKRANTTSRPPPSPSFPSIVVEIDDEDTNSYAELARSAKGVKTTGLRRRLPRETEPLGGTSG